MVLTTPPSSSPDARLTESAGVVVLDHDPQARAALERLVAAAGMRVVASSGVDEALALIDGGVAAAVLCGTGDDRVLLGALAHRRRRMRPAWPWPVLAVLPQAAGAADVEQAFALADDCLQMPLSATALGARLRPFLRMCDYATRTQAQRTALRRHQDEAEAEQRIASHLIARLERRDAVAERLIQAWVSPARHVSGDVVAVARAPDDRIHVLLADGTGNGLSAAISVLPVSEVFHRMTDRGFDIASIVTEMNRKLRSCMPVDRFVACVAASVDMHGHAIELWNGGCPPVILLGADGRVQRVCRSRHMALGILDSQQFDSSVERCDYVERSQLMVVSDGLSEAPGGDGVQRFGDRELLEAVRGAAVHRLGRVVSRLYAFTGGRALEDDASVLLVDCRMAPPVDAAPMASPPAVEAASDWSLELRLGPSQLRGLALVPLVSDLVEQLGIPRRLRAAVFRVLSALLVDALDHGVLGLDPGMADLPGGAERFRVERAARLSRLDDGWLRIRSAIEPSSGGALLRLECEDSGAGVDSEAGDSRRVPGREASMSRRGRGVEQVRSICTDLSVDRVGRRVVALLALSDPGGRDGSSA